LYTHSFLCAQHGIIPETYSTQIMCRDVSFMDLYEGIRERVFEGKSLPARETYQLVECVKSAEQVGGV
jgi:hypothetical protein